jgi:hypothetical protein
MCPGAGRWRLEHKPSQIRNQPMPREIISTPEAPQSPMYSQAVKAGHTIYVAGTPGIDVAVTD